MLEGVVESQRLLKDFFPERARVVGVVLRECNERYKKLEAWQEKQLVHFMGILMFSVSDLQRAHDEKMISTLAWVVRNLLELSIWIDYCCGSDKSAKRFQDDAIRDMYGWSKAILSMYKAQHTVEHENLAKKMGDLEEFAKSRGLPKLEDDFKRVRDAAEELGRDADFGSRYKLYSKFAHPTAWVVHSASSIETDEDFRDIFFIDGVELAVTSLSRIRNSVLSLFPELRDQESESR
jgi:hypothetical protein